MGNIDNLDDIVHYESNLFKLLVFEKSLKHVVTVVQDNCASNRAMSLCICSTFFWCHSHRYILAITEALTQIEEEIKSVKVIVPKLLSHIPAAKLPILTSFKAKKLN